ncbi:YecA family protein [Pedobacter aquatilis]|uniref:YecA family protein n=1 Tax=Pedobacter aquatilis TaxID=351343 RepID=UPI00292D5DCB|nr:SEC-C metal-binding domain-containing protein [Pedobacter aquatilis]
MSVKECSLIIGFLVQCPMNLSFPKSPEEVIEMKEKTYELAHELQMSFSAPQFAKMREMMESMDNGQELPIHLNDKVDFFVKDGGIIEPTFYAGDGVYDFQYLEYLEPKYRYDGEWLCTNKGFQIEEVIDVVNRIKQILHEKSKQVTLFELKENFAGIMQKAKKKLTKLYSKEGFKKIEREQFVALNFRQYMKLFPKPDRLKKDNTEDWKQFYRNLLDLFTIKTDDFSSQEGLTVFFANFSFTPDCNLNYQGPGHYNILNSRPLIQLDQQRYFVPINYLVAEAVYESPFYWMWEDTKYRSQLAKHRGDVGEEMAYEFLCKVFGKENTFKSVLLSAKKGQTETDIDVLCLLGNKALCVQVKSKKMTLMAKRGDFEQLSKDFKGAIQDAYDQGVVSRQGILDKKVRFLDANGADIPKLNREINEVYIMGLTTENYPSLVHQVHTMLEKDDKCPSPLFISIFDLELLVHYLPDPYDFLYYVRQRINLLDYFHASEELVFLGYHLRNKLWKIDKYDGGMLDSDFGANIDRNYYPYKTGMSHLVSEKDDPILNRWKPKHFDLLLKNLKHSSHENITDIIFSLLDFSGDAQEEIVKNMIAYKQTAIKENRRTTLAYPAAPDFGLTYVVSETDDPEKLETVSEVYSVLRKYKSKCNTWLGLGTFTRSPNMVDYIIYLDEPWTFDQELETECNNFFGTDSPGRRIPVGNHVKVGRNEPCPCKSGKKYKKCCGIN